ncbi:uncharacterized protein LOC109829181 [Asparagus officinalis]|uniref:uncharacterized protein LOC109829181 n=1 Tax=Asparagus officinalis TaxID=4686 RepID=UPI00098DED79|nr:uncharacterized protein LOC109829181 [Asparagus officinalis]
MPSGAKKRKKAAAKKKEGEKQTTEQDLEAKTEMEGSENAREENPSPDASSAERPTEISLEKVETSDVKDVGFEHVESKEEVGSSGLGREICVSERPNEFVESKEEARNGNFEREICVSEAPNEFLEVKGEVGTERRTEISLEKPSEEETEQVIEASEVPLSVPADSAVSEGEERGEMPIMGTVIETPETAGQSHFPILEQRASLWNCCGLLDLFKGSQ